MNPNIGPLTKSPSCVGEDGSTMVCLWDSQSAFTQEMAAPEHTALLLKCYTKLKDFTTLEVYVYQWGMDRMDHQEL